jgi:hypothetical protein
MNSATLSRVDIHLYLTQIVLYGRRVWVLRFAIPTHGLRSGYNTVPLLWSWGARFAQCCR